MKCDFSWFGDMIIKHNKPFLIAEIGVNYENDMRLAKEMIKQAADSGCDAVKFQTYKAEKLASKFATAYWDISKEPTPNQQELFKKYDSFGKEEYEELARFAKKCGVIFMSTPFDTEAADFLDPIVPAFKIASADLTNFVLLEHCAKKGKPMILSTGAATIDEIKKAVKVVRKYNSNSLALLHCVLSYPTSEANANLLSIKVLKKEFPSCIIGNSCHVPPADRGLAQALSWLNGAVIIEKHFTLDKTLPGNDHYHAFDPQDVRDFREMCDKINLLNGNMIKDVLPCEKNSRLHARRSLVAAKNIMAGELVLEYMLAVKRPGTGIEVEHMDRVIGKVAVKNIEEDAILQWDMFE